MHAVPTPVHQPPPRAHPSTDGRFGRWLPVLVFLTHFCLGLLASEMALSPGDYRCFLMVWPVPAPLSALERCPQTSLLFSSAPLSGLLNAPVSYSQPPPPHCCCEQSLSFLHLNPLQASSDLYARKYKTTVSPTHFLVFFPSKAWVKKTNGAWQPIPVFLPGEAWRALVHRVAKSRTRLSTQET